MGEIAHDGDATGAAALERTGKIAIGAAAGAFFGLVAYVVGAFATDPYAAYADLDTAIGLATEITLLKLALVGIGALVGGRLASGRWSPVGVALYASLVVTVLGFILYSATVMLPRNFSALNLLLFVAESISLLFVCVYAFYSIDRTARRDWRRHFARVARTPNAYPVVEFHVPLYNEPPHIVMEVLDCLLRMDYPQDRFRIAVADDSTDEATRAEIEAFCGEHADRIRYVHRGNRRGFKAGALNELVAKLDPRVELIAVVDADYKVQPNFLKEVVGYFEENPDLGFLQTPQDFHNVDYSEFTREIYWANKYFYDAIMPARNEANSIIFCGTMGIVRKRALAEAGGWGEDVLCEDAETSIRILAEGWQSLYVPKVYGRGLLPQSYAAYKSQQYRWAFGGCQLLKKHGTKTFFSRLSARQRWDMVTGSLHYFSGIMLTMVAAILLVLGLSEIYGKPIVNFHKGEIILMGFVPFFIMLEGTLRMRWALGKSMGLDLKQTMQVMGVWFSMMFFTTWAALKVFAGSKEGFVRTPKHRARKVSRWRAWFRAVRLMKFETTMAWCLGVTAVAVTLQNLAKLEWLWDDGPTTVFAAFTLSFWLAWYAYVFACGPIYAERGSRGPA